MEIISHFKRKNWSGVLDNILHVVDAVNATNYTAQASLRWRDGELQRRRIRERIATKRHFNYAGVTKVTRNKALL